MKPGDLVRFTCHPTSPYGKEPLVGILISSRNTKWDRSIYFYKFLTPGGVREVILGVPGTSCEVISETR